MRKISNLMNLHAPGLAWQLRLRTSRIRALPNFMIIGAQKSGTRSLHAYLSQHPNIMPAHRAEIHYFDGGTSPAINHFEKGPEWYRAHFPLKNQLGTESKTFEKSPLYLFNPLVPKRIFELIPEVKLIVLLRNPTERAISHYFHEKRKGREHLPLQEAFRAEENRLADVLANQKYKSAEFKNWSYKNRGLYALQLERYFRYFPRQQILVLKSESFFNNPGLVTREVFDFVGVRSDFNVRDLTPLNVGKSKKNIEAKVYSYLNNFFKSHNQALYELIEKDFAW